MVYLGYLTHYNHKNICRGVSEWGTGRGVRDFDTLDKMNSTIVNGINSVVGQDDILIHLGDWSFGGFESIAEFRSRIVCKNIHLFLGNHDHHIKKNKDNCRELFTSVSKYNIIQVVIPKPHEIFGGPDKYNFVCFHHPISSWEEMGSGVMHLFGHVHLPKKSVVREGRSMDVGVDGNNFIPYSLKEVVKLIGNKEIAGITIPKDHHVTK